MFIAVERFVCGGLHVLATRYTGHRSYPHFNFTQSGLFLLNSARHYSMTVPTVSANFPPMLSLPHIVTHITTPQIYKYAG